MCNKTNDRLSDKIQKKLSKFWLISLYFPSTRLRSSSFGLFGAILTPECEHVNSTSRWSAHNSYRSDLNSVTTDNFTNSWSSIRAHLKYATCHFYIRKHAVPNGTFSLVFMIILQANLVSSRSLKCQMIYSSPCCHLHCGKGVEGRGKIYFKLSLSLGMQSTREGEI